MKNKRFLSIALTLAIMLSLAAPAFADANTIQTDITYRNIIVTLDNKRLSLTDVDGNAVDPFIMSGTTYLPVRAISEALGLTVNWVPETNTVELSSVKSPDEQPQGNGYSGGDAAAYSAPTVNTVQASITYRDIVVTLDGARLKLSDVDGNAVDPFIMSGTTYLPVRAISEALGLTVNWVPETNTVALSTYTADDSPDTDWSNKYDGFLDSYDFSSYTGLSASCPGAAICVIGSEDIAFMSMTIEEEGITNTLDVYADEEYTIMILSTEENGVSAPALYCKEPVQPEEEGDNEEENEAEEEEGHILSTIYDEESTISYEKQSTVNGVVYDVLKVTNPPAAEDATTVKPELAYVYIHRDTQKIAYVEAAIADSDEMCRIELLESAPVQPAIPEDAVETPYFDLAMSLLAYIFYLAEKMPFAVG